MIITPDTKMIVSRDVVRYVSRADQGTILLTCNDGTRVRLRHAESDRWFIKASMAGNIIFWKLSRPKGRDSMQIDIRNFLQVNSSDGGYMAAQRVIDMFMEGTPVDDIVAFIEL